MEAAITLSDSLSEPPVAVAIVDADQRFRFVNSAFERWFGCARVEVSGRRVEDVLAGEAFAALRGPMARALAGETLTFATEVPQAEGGERVVEATYVAQPAPDGSVAGFIALLTDVTERRRLERAHAAAAARAERLLKITAAIADAVSADEVFEAVVDRVALALGASSAAVWLIDDDGRTATLARAHGYADLVARRLHSLALGAEPSVPAQDALKLGEPVWIASQRELLERYPHLASTVTPTRTYRVACLPLLAQGRTLGVLGLTIDGPEEGAADERDFLLLVARYASQAVERVRLFEAERRSRAEADAAAARTEELYRFAHAVVAAEAVEQVFEAALDAIHTGLGAERAAILVQDSDGVMRFRAWRGLSDAYRRAVEGHSPWPRDAVSAQPVLVPDVEADPSLQPLRPALRAEGIGALAFIPLATRGRLLGKFMVYYREPHTFSPQDLALASAIANHLGSAAARFAAVAKLEETVRVNRLFAGVLAHDLRNPLAAMMMAAQLMIMRQDSGGDRNSKPLARIIGSGERMRLMIDQLLDFTRASIGGGIAVQPRAANLADLCAQAVAELELSFPDARVRRDVVGDQGGTWDPERLLQVFSNLVGNACQHGEADKEIVIELDGRGADQVSFRVHNAGRLPEALMPSLFDAFRGTRHRRDQSRGLGLGLYIVKEIVRAHGGSVAVVSSEDAGTTFTVALPRHAAAVPQRELKM